MLGIKIVIILSTLLNLGWYVGAIPTMTLVLVCSASTTTMAIATVTIPSGLFLGPFSSHKAALSKSKAHKRTRIDKEKKNKKTKGAQSPLITGEGRLGCSRQ